MTPKPTLDVKGGKGVVLDLFQQNTKPRHSPTLVFLDRVNGKR